MLRMRLSLAIASFVILIVSGVVFYDQFFYRWERHQTAYFEQARSLSKDPQERAELEARSPRIEQTLVTSFGDTRVDRCTTCHIAIDDPRFAGHAQPLKTHPYSAALGDVQRNGHWERRHRFSDFGCTVCHDGQGRGLETKYSHGEDEFWLRSTIEGRLVKLMTHRRFNVASIISVVFLGCTTVLCLATQIVSPWDY